MYYTKKRLLIFRKRFFVERKRFELSKRCRLRTFQARSFNHSDTSLYSGCEISYNYLDLQYDTQHYLFGH